MAGCDSTDASGLSLLTSGSWNADTSLNIQGGQGMHFKVSNTNALGTTISISTQLNQSEQRIIPPLGSVDIAFSTFVNEPFGWQFDVSTESDAFIVTWCLYSTWVVGDPPNPAPSQQPPVVTGINPASGPAGTTVTITGSGFAGVTDINFGSTNVDLLGVGSNTLIVDAPGNPGGSPVVDITVTNAVGTSATSPADQFTYS